MQYIKYQRIVGTSGVGFEVEETSIIDVSFSLGTGVVELPLTGEEDSLWGGGFWVGVSWIVAGSWETEESIFCVVVDSFDCRLICWGCCTYKGCCEDIYCCGNCWGIIWPGTIMYWDTSVVYEDV